jgi:adenylyl-sulfate kinase
MSGFCLWLTGLSGAGKTTLALELVKELGLNIDKRLIHHLDGDIVRKSFTSDLGFSKGDRDENIKRVSYVASYLSHSGNAVICTFISPYREARKKAAELCNDFIEVYVDCPIEVCEERDVKGLYKKARAGEIKQFTGISDPYEKPEDPDIVVHTKIHNVKVCTYQIMAYLKQRGLC